jgi:hypothetical protein
MHGRDKGSFRRIPCPQLNCKEPAGMEEVGTKDGHPSLQLLALAKDGHPYSLSWQLSAAEKHGTLRTGPKTARGQRTRLACKQWTWCWQGACTTEGARACAGARERSTLHPIQLWTNERTSERASKQIINGPSEKYPARSLSPFQAAATQVRTGAEAGEGEEGPSA